jgi:hypothetical protein
MWLFIQKESAIATDLEMQTCCALTPELPTTSKVPGTPVFAG